MSTGIKPRPFRTPHGVALAFTTIGFGTAPLGNLYRPLTEQEARAALEAAWTIGCRAHGVPLAAAALQFPLAHPAVVSVIPGGQSSRELHQNLAALRHPIPGALWDDLKRAGLLREDAPVPADP
jgi:D-threo-aldose 1-dehydrogenase